MSKKKKKKKKKKIPPPHKKKIHNSTIKNMIFDPSLRLQNRTYYSFSQETGNTNPPSSTICYKNMEWEQEEKEQKEEEKEETSRSHSSSSMSVPELTYEEINQPFSRYCFGCRQTLYTEYRPYVLSVYLQKYDDKTKEKRTGLWKTCAVCKIDYCTQCVKKETPYLPCLFLGFRCQDCRLLKKDPVYVDNYNPRRIPDHRRDCQKIGCGINLYSMTRNS